MTENLQQRIQRHEGLRLEPYKDSLGFDTVGYGHRILPTDYFNYPLSPELALSLLQADIASHELDLLSQLPWSENLPNTIQDVLIELCFWIGITGLRGFKRMLLAIEAGDRDGAVMQLLDSKLHEQCPARTEELSRLILT